MSRRIKFISLSFAVLFVLSVQSHGQPGLPAPTVMVGTVTEAEIVETRRYPGILAAPQSVDLVARVSGELLKVGFREGDMVKAGQLLYQLDEVRYAALVDVAKANIARCEASLRYSESNYNRINGLFEKKVDTRDSMEKALMAFHTDRASLAAAKSSLVTAADDLKNTKIVAPIGGKIGATRFTRGNYLTPSSGVLATIVQLDPIRLSFSLSNRDFLTLFGSEENFRQGARIRIRLANGQDYDEEGTFEFRNNEANRSTDTLTLYVSFPNPKFELLPGSSVTVLLSQKTKSRYASIAPTAVMNDEKTNYVYVVGDGNVVSRRDITVGPLVDGRWMVKSGLKVGERVVIDGTHKVRPGAPVNPASR